MSLTLTEKCIRSSSRTIREEFSRVKKKEINDCDTILNIIKMVN